jgi:transcriptional regulator with XRE-family HTH domain
MSEILAKKLEFIVKTKFNGNWSQLAKKCNMIPSTLQQIKKGGEPRESTLLRISNSLNVSLDWLLKEQGEIIYRPLPEKSLTRPQTTNNIEKNIDEKICEKIKKLTNKQKKEVLSNIQNMILHNLSEEMKKEMDELRKEKLE